MFKAKVIHKIAIYLLKNLILENLIIIFSNKKNTNNVVLLFLVHFFNNGQIWVNNLTSSN